jgi:2',3'-cyclic-nucleotide 2'-phosphodiesterase (5'-nucleotidase family)
MLEKGIKSVVRVIIALSMLVILASCSKPAPTLEKRVVIIQTSDIHSHFSGSPNGISLAANIAEARKKAGGADKTLLIDTGDTLQGTIAASLSQGEIGLLMLNSMRYDAWVLGNHDYDFGTTRLAELMKKANCDVLAANLAWKSESKQLKSWKLYTKNGIKIALIGLTSPYLRKWFWGDKLNGVQILPAMEVLDELMPEVLKAKPDFTILAIHHGPYTPRRLDSDVGIHVRAIAKRYPQINLILGGHTHQSIPGEEFGNDTWFVEPGCHAEKFAWIEVAFDPTGRKRPVIHSKLVSTKRVPKNEYARFAAPVKKWLKKSWRFSHKVVTKVNHPIKPAGSLSIPPYSMERLICESIARVAKTKIAICGAVNDYAELSGKATEWNLFKAAPFEDNVCVLNLNRGEFLEIVNEQIKKWDKGRPQSVFGISVKGGWTPEKIYPSDTILRLPNGKMWKSRTKRVRVAFSSYVLASAGGRFPKLNEIANRTTSKGKDTNIVLRDAIRNFLKSAK